MLHKEWKARQGSCELSGEDKTSVVPPTCIGLVVLRRALSARRRTRASRAMRSVRCDAITRALGSHPYIGPLYPRHRPRRDGRPRLPYPERSRRVRRPRCIEPQRLGGEQDFSRAASPVEPVDFRREIFFSADVGAGRIVSSLSGSDLGKWGYPPSPQISGIIKLARQ
jgi:hypothetical protein